VVTGYSYLTSGYSRAFRWTQSGGMVNLGVPSGGGWVSSAAYGVSGNGLVVVGVANKTQANSDRAFRWSGGVMTSLGTLKQGSYSEAWATNTNGSVVVGTSDSNSGDRAFRWTGNKMTDLGTLPGQPNSYGLAVSGDGLKIVGYCSDGSQEVPFPAVHPHHRSAPSSIQGIPGSGGAMVDLNTYLPTLGLNLTGWTLREARGISADGTTIVGWGWHNGSPEPGWPASFRRAKLHSVSPPCTPNSAAASARSGSSPQSATCCRQARRANRADCGTGRQRERAHPQSAVRATP
jgi:probable HAF family extracellular repeat protein